MYNNIKIRTNAKMSSSNTDSKKIFSTQRSSAKGGVKKRLHIVITAIVKKQQFGPAGMSFI